MGWLVPLFLGAALWGWGETTFLKGLGSELAFRARPAEGQEGTECSLNPAWVGSR